MLEFKTREGNVERLCVSGSLKDIMADISLLIVMTHRELLESDKEQADLFKNCMKKAVNDEAVFADGMFAESIKKHKNTEDRVNDLIKKLEADEIDNDTIDGAINAFISALEGKK